MSQRPSEDGMLRIGAIAETCRQIHRQHRSAGTREVNLRALKEVF